MMQKGTQTRLVQNLRDANRRLLFWLDSLTFGDGSVAPATPQQMSGLLSELMRAGEWLRAAKSAQEDPELAIELAEYRHHVEKLRELLPLIHQQLLTERSRLESERSRIGAAAEWARGARQTL